MPDAGAAPRRDNRSFEEFVADRGTALLRTAVILTGDRQAGEDLLQDVLLRAHRRWRHVDDPYSYLRRSLVNASVSRARRRLRAREDLVGWDEDPAADVLAWPARDEIGRVPDRHDLLALLRRLPPRQRAVIALRYYDDLSVSQIAAELGCGEGSVRTHASRGLARLRELMDPEEPAAAREAARPEKSSARPAPLTGRKGARA
ncbi:SigE family RNA polymerase sigma factor [Frankia sp. CNm7]|uniref:SigE family RNA polymerase sigma factor n=1 Tax=Frankia nepalensis TaxID=1836974 RepID=A0A937RKG5_9ACTN|nr:SigE family RNA polymerase sigma factor [Frankia nepalensis]MBL7502590.1 SigE family RNA polymerase sigma factor [Frankia nepalensis]MBL7514745.1 SigE family RNA polymerase sigma factor [Frankia nepalensis]MBL7517959.1 SigE family RNA polymerase sigma factor [Frankia nepalensis]MBL7628974.1 SigE family RNA polymerase sigma factor [Frankia nepalensis]